MGVVFVSYRRQDTQQAAGRLAENLVGRFGRDAVVIDVDTDQVGRDYRELITRHLDDADVVVVVVGSDFVGSMDGGRRIDSPSDFVRIEVARALEREIPVIPVLVDNASMPEADDLPQDVRDLTYRGAVELTHHRFDRDFSFLAERIARMLDVDSATGDDSASPAQDGSTTGVVLGPARWFAIFALWLLVGWGLALLVSLASADRWHAAFYVTIWLGVWALGTYLTIRIVRSFQDRSPR